MLNLLASRRLTSADNHVLTRADTMSPYGANAISVDVRYPAAPGA
jgi:hypothetical protein